MNPLDFRHPYELRVTAVASDIDALGHVNNIVYLRWVQDAAIAHWSALATAEMQQEIVWMVLRHEIDTKPPPKKGTTSSSVPGLALPRDSGLIGILRC